MKRTRAHDNSSSAAADLRALAVGELMALFAFKMWALGQIAAM